MRLRIRTSTGEQQDEPSTSQAPTMATRSRAPQHLPSLFNMNDDEDDSSAQSSPKRSSPSSPHSPVSRVAKRNARILSGLDLGHHSSSYPEHLVGTIPDFSIRRIQEVCPALVQALQVQEKRKSSEHVLDDTVLTELQFQLESLLAENVDWQKNIHGEMTFLSTGDYPTDDLRSRPMPSYELREDHFASHQMDTDDPQPSISYIDHYKQDDDDAGSDVISSMNENEKDEPYCVLDIPHRFWTWVREYIGHVDEKFLRDFDENLFQRYQPEQLEEFFINEPFKYKPSKQQKDPESPKHHRLNGVHKEHQSGRKNSKAQANAQTNGIHEETPPSPPARKRASIQATRDQLLKSLKSEDSASDLMKRLVTAYVKDQSIAGNKKKPGRKPFNKPIMSPKLSSTSAPSSPSKKQRSRKKSTKKLNGELNGKSNGHINGIESTDDEAHQNDLFNNEDLMESIGQALANCVMPAVGTSGHSNGVNGDLEDTDEEDSLEQEDPEATQDSVQLSNNMENYEMVNLRLEGKKSVEDLDEVSAELLKAQQRLEQLIKKTSPVLNKCKKELEAEHAYWLTNRALNSVDDELFHLTNQIPNGATNPPEELFKRCLDVWDERKQYLLQHYIRDHVKFVQYAEKSNKDADAALTGIQTTPGKRHEQGSPSHTKSQTRSNRKKSNVKKELQAQESLED